MRYDEESGEIIISVGEFVSTARRKISTRVPHDEDEPSLSGAPKRKGAGVEISYSFHSRDYTFRLVGRLESEEGDSIVICVPTDTSAHRPRRETVAQARGVGYVCAYALAKIQGFTSVEINCHYINYDTGEDNLVTERAKIKKLESFFDKCLVSVEIYAAPEVERVTKRLETMRRVKFPYKNTRQGQSDFVRAVYRNIARGGRLFAAAPTGTGKTVSALFPAVRALGEGLCEKVFYFTPKTTTANAARDCIEDLRAAGADVRAVVISAKEKICENRTVCRQDRDACENSRQNKICDAVLALYKSGCGVVGHKDIHEVARSFRVCPYELSLSYAELCDVVICDINYLFDPAVYIRRFFEEGGSYAFLIDEAHNLPDRAREMYSAEISEEIIVGPSVDNLFGEHSPIKAPSREGAKLFYDTLYPYVKEELVVDEGILRGAAHLSHVPAPLYELFDRLISKTEEAIFDNYSAVDDGKAARDFALRDYYYKLKKFRTAAADFDSSYEFFIFIDDGNIRAKCFCIDPGRQISRRLDKGGSAVMFSATLSPMYYYKSVLGGDGSSEILELESPFDSSQLSVSIMDKISTRLVERDDTLLAVCRAIAACVSARRGNYMIFSPSFAYSDALYRVFSAKYPKIRTLKQAKDMRSKEKAAFLDAFKDKNDDSYLIGFCVMGGIYSEGVDLVGDSLIGAVVVGIGIPSLSYEREAMCAYYNERFEEGKQFAYIYPGMNRVLQAAGRVIRSEGDKGVIVLIDDRFDDPIYKTVIPGLWSSMKFIDDPKALRAELDEFWREDKE